MLESSFITKIILWNLNVWLWLILLSKLLIFIVKWTSIKVVMPLNNNFLNFTIHNTSIILRILYVKMYLPVKDSCTQMTNYWRLSNKDLMKSIAQKRKHSLASMKQEIVQVLPDYMNFVNLVVVALLMPPIY